MCRRVSDDRPFGVERSLLDKHHPCPLADDLRPEPRPLPGLLFALGRYVHQERVAGIANERPLPTSKSIDSATLMSLRAGRTADVPTRWGMRASPCCSNTSERARKSVRPARDAAFRCAVERRTFPGLSAASSVMLLTRCSRNFPHAPRVRPSTRLKRPIASPSLQQYGKRSSRPEVAHPLRRRFAASCNQVVAAPAAGVHAPTADRASRVRAGPRTGQEAPHAAEHHLGRQELEIHFKPG